MAVSDVEKDPRFYADVGERIGYATKSLLCAPMMTHGHSFGCVQLINRKGGPQFLDGRRHPRQVERGPPQELRVRNNRRGNTR